ncbi:phage portal protein [Candidatus Termititenax aidoneus]|uniref:Phage portal protein n=1 Tax=Termititenax aidoneus TaxID=2218524 RepID=A0A388TCN3_TERA1|nr:phage portal protein [Candidatus Termititenax aidoneus]
MFTNVENGEYIPDKNIDEAIILPIKSGYAGMSISRMVELIVGHMALTGNELWIKSKSSAYALTKGIAEEFIPVPAGNWQPNLSANQIQLKSYDVWFGGGARYTVSPDDVLHFKQSTLYSPFIGIGNITKLRLLAEGEISGQEYVNAFLERGAAPSIVILDKSDRTPDDNKRYADQLREAYEGRNNTGKLMYLSGDADAKTLNISNKDMQFLESKNYNRQSILSMFGVSEFVAGILGSVNRATADKAVIMFFEHINKILEGIEDVINFQHVQKIDPKIKFSFEKYPTGDVDNIVKMVTNGIINPNRAAELVGEDFDLKDKGRNEFYLPLTLMPLGADRTAELDNPADTDKTTCGCGHEHKNIDRRLLNPRYVDLIADTFEKSATKPKKFQAQYIRASLRSRNTVEDKYIARLSDFFAAQEQRVLDGIQSFYGKSAVQKKDLSEEELLAIIFNIQNENNVLRETLRSLHTSALQRAIGDIAKITGAQLNLDLTKPSIQLAISRLGSQITGEINQTTLKNLQRVITDAINDNLNIDDITNNVKAEFDSFKGYRARMIARTESREAWDAGADEAYKDLGVEYCDVVGCTEFEPTSDCGAQHVPMAQVSSLHYHPNHIGCIAPSYQV